MSVKGIGSMRLKSSSGQAFELTIVRYQYPNCGTEYYDANWLVIKGRVQHSRGSWVFIDPCLLTDEVAELCQWLLDVASGATVNSECEFIEPNLRFAHVANSTGDLLRIYFELEARPDWAYTGTVDDDDLCWVEFPLLNLDLRVAAVALREQLETFPPRLAE